MLFLETGGSSQLQLEASNPWKNAVLLCTLNQNCAHRPVEQTCTGHTLVRVLASHVSDCFPPFTHLPLSGLFCLEL